MEEWRGGDERAATRLVERHAGPVARYLAGLGARDELDELVQDTFVRAFGSLDGFRGESALRTWLLTIARRLLVDRRRARRRRAEEVTIGESEAASGYDALDALVASESEQRVAVAIGSLSPMQREVFTLRVNEGLSYREIADLVGSTEGAARVHYHNAMRAVKERLDD
ncbi:MAG TPA: RNA polymerase sigma factor [Gemmatimonadaceae bacterium]